MAITTFDTLKFVRRLEEAGVSSEQAEVQAEVLTEAFNVNLEELVSKDYLAVQFAEQKTYIDKRFEQVNTRFAEQNANFKLLYWMVGIVIATNFIPFLQMVASL